MQNEKLNPARLRIIWVALLAGQFVFAGVAFVLRSGGLVSGPTGTPTEQARLTAILSAIAIVKLLACGAASLLIPAFFKPGDQRQPPTPQTLATRHVVRMALLEGPSLFGTVVFLLTGSLVGLGVTAAAVALFVLTTFPSATRR